MALHIGNYNRRERDNEIKGTRHSKNCCKNEKTFSFFVCDVRKTEKEKLTEPTKEKEMLTVNTQYNRQFIPCLFHLSLYVIVERQTGRGIERDQWPLHTTSTVCLRVHSN